MEQTKFKNLWLGENEISNPDMQIIIHTAFPHCAVTFPTNPVDQEDYNARTQLQIFESAPYTEADIKRTTALIREFISAIVLRDSLPPRMGTQITPHLSPPPRSPLNFLLFNS